MPAGSTLTYSGTVVLVVVPGDVDVELVDVVAGTVDVVEVVDVVVGVEVELVVVGTGPVVETQVDVEDSATGTGSPQPPDPAASSSPPDRNTTHQRPWKPQPHPLDRSMRDTFPFPAYPEHTPDPAFRITIPTLQPQVRPGTTHRVTVCRGATDIQSHRRILWFPQR
jgi:hypothetical protein